MICTSISEPTAEKCLEALENLHFAEIRLDRMSVDAEDVKAIFSLPKRLIATCRPGTLEDSERKAHLMNAVTAGASYVDIEIESQESYRAEIIQTAKSANCKVIISYHNDQKTPDRDELRHLVESGFDAGADIVKIACKVHSPRENARLLGLLEDERPLIVIGMGAGGTITRITAPFLGSVMTYASLEPGKETAPGQISKPPLEELLRRIANVG